MTNRRFLGAGCHPQRPKETVDQDVELVHVPAITYTHILDYYTVSAHQQSV